MWSETEGRSSRYAAWHADNCPAQRTAEKQDSGLGMRLRLWKNCLCKRQSSLTREDAILWMPDRYNAKTTRCVQKI